MSEKPNELANTTFDFSNASVTNYTLNYTEFDGIITYIAYYGWDVTTFICLTTVVFGSLSWTLLPKWRRFRNYVFTNASFAISIVLVLNNFKTGTILDFLCDVGYSAFPCWLVLCAYSYYMEVVKIFSYHTDHVYLYANIFAWVMPALICIFCNIFHYDCDDEDKGYDVINYTEVVSSIVNLLLYLKVVFVLKASGNIRSSFTVSSCQRLRVATVIFVTSGAAMFVPFLILVKMQLKPELSYLPTFIFLIQVCLMQLMFLMLKYHRTLWREFMYKRFWRNYSIRTTTETRNNSAHQEREFIPTYLPRKDLPI